MLYGKSDSGKRQVRFWQTVSRILVIGKSDSGDRQVGFWQTASRILVIGKSDSGKRQVGFWSASQILVIGKSDSGKRLAEFRISKTVFFFRNSLKISGSRFVTSAHGIIMHLKIRSMMLFIHVSTRIANLQT
jgi:hypothetical protein